jgi:hypothetical protein
MGVLLVKSYDVALWRCWPSLFPEWTEMVKAFSESQAVYALMRAHGLRFVEKAAVSAGDGSPIERYYDVLCPKQREEVLTDD